MFRDHRECGRVLRLSRDEATALVEELRAQIDACRRAGLPVTHLDSHEHVHTEPGIAQVVIALARELSLPHVRLTRNCRPAVPLSTRVYRALFNARLRRAGLAATRYFGDIDDYVAFRHADAKHTKPYNLELMTHPALDEEGQLVDYHCSQPGKPLELLLANVDGLEQAVSYSGARL
jgi:predicted glycoside hydrolase/deacetylase ChbG (UPF0249 family)